MWTVCDQSHVCRSTSKAKPVGQRSACSLLSDVQAYTSLHVVADRRKKSPALLPSHSVVSRSRDAASCAVVAAAKADATSTAAHILLASVEMELALK